MSRAILLLVSLASGGCAPNLTGYWDIVSWEVTRPDGSTVFTDDVGFAEFEGSNYVFTLSRYDYLGGEEFVPLLEPFQRTTQYDRLESEMGTLVLGFAAIMEPTRRNPTRVTYEPVADQAVVPLFETTEFTGWSLSYELARP